MASSAVRKSAAASSSSTSLRFLGVLKQPAGVPTPSPATSLLEFDESDMFWSSTTAAPDAVPSNSHSAGPNSPISTSSSVSSFASSDAAAYSPSSASSQRGRRPFGPERSGLSAALGDDPAPVLKTRRPAVDLYLSAARAVPAAPGAAPGDRLVMSGSGKLLHMSAPVNVPTWPRKKPPRGGVRGWGFDDDDEDGFAEERQHGRRFQEEGEEEEAEEDEDGGVMVPPHIIVARSHVTTFSVFEGVGRTLKGRDLRRVRNAVLQKTGFLD